MNEAKILRRKTKYVRRYYNMQIVNYVREATAAFLKHSNINREVRARGVPRGGEAAGAGLQYTLHVPSAVKRQDAEHFPVQRDPYDPISEVNVPILQHENRLTGNENELGFASFISKSQTSCQPSNSFTERLIKCTRPVERNKLYTSPNTAARVKWRLFYFSS